MKQYKRGQSHIMGFCTLAGENYSM